MADSIASMQLGDEIIACVRRALSEDIGSGDVTTNSIVPSAAPAAARIVTKQDGILSGLAVAQAAFLLLSCDMRFNSTLSDGAKVVRGQTLLELDGPARAILSGERTALNFLGRMSGIATLTRKFVNAIAGTKAAILDTRKTAPGLRAVDKLAVQHGGGANHRLGLYDMLLIKNNHIDCAGSLSRAVDLARAAGHNMEIEIETRTIEEMVEALTLGVERILLDNMSLDELRRAVALGAGRAKLEASGDVSLDNVREIAETGVDYISVGALTHSAKAFDVNLRWLR
ncbi:MAG TPA: carboxylating nicotinate-nucleotide diphosphorylase [Pyrinomonadaceae bacterium]|jgi:nicotinate-nucleotide pyrophosphorylase (carboxylating)